MYILKNSGRFALRARLIASLLLACLFTLRAQPARAGDIESAKQALERVKVDVDNNSWDSVDEDIKSTEDFLDGVPDADKAPVQAELDALKVKAAAGVKDKKSKTIVATATSDLNRAAESINQNPSQVADILNTTIQRLNGDDAKKYVDADQLKKLNDRATSLLDMATKKTMDQKLDRAAPIVKELDDAMAASPLKGLSGNDLDHKVQDLNGLMSRIRGAIDGIPATDPRVKAINDKLALYTTQISASVGNAAQTEAAQNLARIWANQKDYFKGWDQEKQGPTWDEYSHKQGGDMDELLMPKTVELLRRMDGWFTGDAVKATSEQYKDDPTVKATMAEAHQAVDTAAAKLHAAFNVVLDGADKIPTPKSSYDRDKATYLMQHADNWFKGTLYHDQDVARAKGIFDKWNGAVAGAAAVQDAALKKLTADANANWPKIAEGIKAQSGFTPSKASDFKGKTIHLTGRNRSGWDFNAAYPFAMDIDGMPVAGKFDDNVKAAVDAAAKQTGRDIDDGAHWDVYGTVEGTGKISRRVNTTSKITLDGEDVATAKNEQYIPEDCTIIRIFAMHAGQVAVGGTPVAAASSGGSGGSASSSDSSSGFSILALLEHLIEFAICVAAAGLVVMKSRPALAGQLGSAGTSVTSIAGNPNIPLAGVAIAIIGVLWLLKGLIYRDFLPATALTFSGVYIAMDLLRSKNILQQSLCDQLRPLGLPIAAATVFFGFLHIFIWNWPFV